MFRRLGVQRGFIVLLALVGSLSVANASKRIVVDLTHQIAIAYQDGHVKFYGRISSGKPGRETPTGSYYVREKDVDHISNLWPQPNGGARMPYMLRITRDGVAMHLGNTPDYPASHGCVRMQNGFAQRMYAWAEKWTKVDIIGKAPAHSPAVALPAYARSTRILRRSIGGGMHGPLAAISTNPKDKDPQSRLAFATIRDVPSSHPRHNRRSSSLIRNHHLNPLDSISNNHRSKKRIERKKRKARIRRKHRHINPLKAIGAH